MLKHRLIATLLLCALSASSTYADIALQNPDARNALNLDGRWNAIIDPYEKGFYNERYEESGSSYFNSGKATTATELMDYDFSRSDKLTVPGDWNTQSEKLFLYEGTIWYHRDFDIGKKIDQQYIIYFGAVNYHTTVYVNGKKIGVHEGGFTPFQFSIKDVIKSGSNSLVVKVDNHRERDQIATISPDWWNYGGITRSVKLIETANAYIDDYSIQMSNTEPDTIEGWVNVKGLDKNSENLQVEVRIPELSISQKVALNRNGRGEFSIAAKPQLWSPDSAKLYAVDFRFQQDSVHDHIGFRTLHVQGENILLNGKSIFLKGISLHEESPLHPGRAWSEEDARAMLTWAKELGCNFVRLAHYPHNETLVRLADKMGLMIRAEIPVYRTILFNNPAVYDKAERQLTELIARDKNRAAVILWSIANDTPNTSARLKFISELAVKARELDPSRLITAAIGSAPDDKGIQVIDDPLAASVDIISVNHHCGWSAGTPASCAAIKWLSRYHKPIILSDFGAEALQGYQGTKDQRWTEEYQAAVFSGNLAMSENISGLRGISPAMLKDFRSPNSHLANMQDFWNRKGVISERGIKKQSWTLLQNYYSGKSADLEKAESRK